MMYKFQPSTLRQQRACHVGFAPGRAMDPTVNMARANSTPERPPTGALPAGTPSQLNAHPFLAMYHSQLYNSMASGEKMEYIRFLSSDLRKAIEILNNVRKRTKGVSLIDDFLNRFRLAFTEAEIATFEADRAKYPSAYLTQYETIKSRANAAKGCENIMPVSHKEYCMSLARSSVARTTRLPQFIAMNSTDRQKELDRLAFLTAWPQADQNDLMIQMSRAEKKKVADMTATKDWKGLQAYFDAFADRVTGDVDEDLPDDGGDSDVDADVDTDVEADIDADEAALTAFVPPEAPSYTMYYALGGLALLGAGAYYWFYVRKS